MHSLPPLTLERRLESRIWGGSTLGPWLGLADAPPNLAESWQVYDQNRVIGGPFAGRRLADLVAEHGAALVHGLVDTFYFVPDLALAFWLLIALVEAARAADT